MRLDRPVVLSLYLDLDPGRFGAPPARATAVRSLLDEADRAVRGREGLSHDDRGRLGQSLERARAFLERDLPSDGAHAAAVFAAEPVDLFETHSLPRSAPSRVAIGRSPLVGPLAALARRDRWCVVLVNRRDARLFLGSPDGLREVDALRDDVHPQHQQGGWSQARYQRSVEKDVADHLGRTADTLLRRFKRRPIDHLLVGGPVELVPDLEGRLHGYLEDRLAGRIEVDVETATAHQVLEAARPRFEELDDERERQALARLDGGARAAAGLENVLPPLNERRVEALMVDERLSAPGSACPACGWLGPEGVERCPADETPLERLEDVVEPAIELALQQSAEVLPVRHRLQELRDRGGIGALLRF